MNWDLWHRKSSFVVRLLLAVWVAVIVVVLCATGHWWGLVFVVPLALDLFLLRRILAAGRVRLARCSADLVGRAALVAMLGAPR